ncbi:MAG: hypothetical protein A2365_02680 [Candidatus Nealsonbacteria bacterium RIFOXYB1_FULL_40_15]|uniref:Type 4 fimbrial biogenesis protein PilX N-terminal domain-containing protein n=2 Tax=Candidatus Nealsoniibacteriota TaxID=1817911 RepID=A0A1G2ENY3_9BACT|nr:MAG: hypothetical protein A2365_02680 [Candidatus Nealsonbacteria bacterium RIFOXYB1_FULL_40_15]OGZ27503.1 MAG: hypothetical protein A2427_01535 [Candidatus Nealsonbacteria bacterium RIFOXYC1_FULL_40_7]OGZ28159.1 MAG: hypothetical protein A2562_02940 [Candidatus Nealsonbacteria bacterium RIFOXYD1_FULL_39_11]
MHKRLNNNKGFALFFTVLISLLIVSGLASAVVILVYNRSKVALDSVKSSQAYYTAEAGIEDLLLKVKRNPNFPASAYSLAVSGNTAEINISEAIGGSRIITSSGNASQRIRKVRVVYSITADSVSFHYGAQVGEGGMEMGNNSRVRGNVYSNGNIVAPSGTGYIDNTLVVAGNGNKMDSISVGEDASAHTCVDSSVAGNLTYVSGGSAASCSAGGTISSQPNQIDLMPLPISSEMINEWKADASAGGIITTDMSYSTASNYLGPVQIGTPSSPKNLTIDTNGVLRITGTVYVTGNLTINNNGILTLDPASYGSLSGSVIADGLISISNNAVLNGSGLAGSYILLLSTNSSVDPASPAVYIRNNAQGAIFYASNGLIYLYNNMLAREVTGYKIKINNNAEIQYEAGLQNALFSSGPGGSWEIQSWEEVE